ncbi:legume-like lectin family-domain-containing protein [Pisolithus marmoratus]|nr:legume-like lectin family-domain-containing protein [Pisolithus marmoratus]
MLPRRFSVFYLVLALLRRVTLRVRNFVYLNQTVQLRTHSIHPPYIDEDLQNRWWDFGADAYINTNKHVRLTRAAPSQMGWLWSRLPLSANNYVIEIEFKIFGESTHLFGDGMAIWLTKERTQPGPVFGNKDKFEGLGIFLDTYANSRHPYGFPRIVAMLGDGKTEYDQAHDGDANSLGSCSAMFRRTNAATKLKIIYVKDTYIDVKLQYKAWDEWTNCFRIEGISLPIAPFLGISALTGEVYDAHDVISVTTWSAILSSKDHRVNELGSAFFIKILFFVGICVGVVYGYKAYMLRSRFGGFGSGGTPMFGGFGDGYGYSNQRRF